MDKFSFYKKRVETALKKYETSRALRETKSNGLYETIMRESAPFRKGYFTVAVIGKMSSGKSTFVNALLENRSLLPTAYEQTTCTLTEIEFGDSLQIEISYGNNSSKKFTDTRELLKAAAIPEEYRHLPINFINKLILANKSEKEIVEGKEKLEEIQGENIDESLLRKYIKTHSKDKIPTKVRIKYPLPDSYRGWKIVDTPGISALGGIEKDTRDFLNGKNEFGYNNVDAIIIVHSSRYAIEDKAFYDFVNQTLLYLSPEARKRIFFVITHATDSEFMDSRNTYLESAKKIFVDRFKIPQSRLLCVDSIASLFYQYAKECTTPIKELKKKDIPQNWDKTTWDTAINVKNRIKDALEEEDCEICNENILLTLKRLSGFEDLKERFDAFTKAEKSASFCRLMKYINDDISSILNDFHQKKNVLESSVGNQSLDELKSKLEVEQRKLSESKTKFNDLIRDVREMFSKNALTKKFEKFATEMRKLRSWTSIKNIQLEATNIMSEVEEEKTSILNELSSTLENLWDKNCSASEVVLPPIDFRSIAMDAEKNNTYKTGGDIIDYHKKIVKREGSIGAVKRFFGSVFRQDSWGYDEVIDYNRPIYSKVETHKDYVKAAQEFANKVYIAFTSGINEFIDHLYSHIQSIGDKAKEYADEQITLQHQSFTDLLSKNQTLAHQKRSIEQFNSKIESLQTTSNELQQLSHD